jgi:hypothetical protein
MINERDFWLWAIGMINLPLSIVFDLLWTRPSVVSYFHIDWNENDKYGIPKEYNNCSIFVLRSSWIFCWNEQSAIHLVKPLLL